MADRSGWEGLWHPAAALPLLLIVGPYYANKFIYMAYPGDYLVFLGADYTNKLLTLSILWLVMRRTTAPLPLPWRLAVEGRRDAAIVVGGTALMIGLDVASWPAKQWLNGITGRLTRYPEPTGPVLAVFDDTVGCLLTGIAEEAIFRFYLINVLVVRGLSVPAAVAVSSVLFGAIHWSYGGGNVAYAALFGVVAAWVFLATRSLAAPVLMHTALDTYFFAGGDAVLRRMVW